MTADIQHDPCTFKQFNDELVDFYKYLKDKKYTDEQILQILSPVLTTHNPKKIKAAILLTITPVAILLLVYLLTYFESVHWHFAALGRIILIKLLPFWDWTALKNEKCLIWRNLDTPDAALAAPQFNCDLCDNIDAIDAYPSIGDKLLQERYLDVHVPVILGDVTSWVHTQNLMANLLTDQVLSESVPCKWATNVHDGPTTVKRLLGRIEIFDTFFLHFQNCDFEAMKQFRQFAKRPQFLPIELAPIQYNWLLWSKNYNGTAYKSVDLIDKVAIVGQVEGSNFLRLIPRGNCRDLCPEINIKLNENEALVLTSLWDLEYRPQEGTENVAVILETH